MITGFTLELDGNPQAIERIWQAVTRQLSQEMLRTPEDVWGGGPIEQAFVMPNLSPVRGQVTFRPVPQPKDAA